MPTSTPAPSVGRIVHYRLSDSDAATINARRADLPSSRGNTVAEGDAFPAVIVRVWPQDRVNLQVLLDGNDAHWATSVDFADEGSALPRTWSWPPRV